MAFPLYFFLSTFLITLIITFHYRLFRLYVSSHEMGDGKMLHGRMLVVDTPPAWFRRSPPYPAAFCCTVLYLTLLPSDYILYMMVTVII